MILGNKSRSKYLPLLILLLVAVCLPMLVRTNFYLSMLVIIGIYGLVATGLVLLFGYGGQISLGQAAFFGTGAYSSAILTKTYGFDPWVALLIGAVVTAGMAALLSIPALRLRGLSAALVTLGFNIIIYILLREVWQVTGGPSGIVGIPALRFGELVVRSERSYFYITWAILWIGIFFGSNLVRSRVGLTLKALNSSEIAAESLGVNTLKFKRQILVISSIYASVAGSLYAHYMSVINPDAFGIAMSFEFVVMVVLGGSSVIFGGLVGAFSIYAISEVLRTVIPILFHNQGGEVEMVFLGAILVLIILFMPEGLGARFSSNSRAQLVNDLAGIEKKGFETGG